MKKKYEEDSRYFNELRTRTVKCKCGKSVTFLRKVDKLLCSNCGHYVYFNKVDEFKDTFKKTIRRNHE